MNKSRVTELLEVPTYFQPSVESELFWATLEQEKRETASYGDMLQQWIQQGREISLTTPDKRIRTQPPDSFHGNDTSNINMSTSSPAKSSPAMMSTSTTPSPLLFNLLLNLEKAKREQENLSAFLEQHM